MRKKKNSPTKMTNEIMMRYGSLQHFVKFKKATYKDIRRLQLGTEELIPKLPFSRLIREIIGNDFRVTAVCLQVKNGLHEN